MHQRGWIRPEFAPKVRLEQIAIQVSRLQRMAPFRPSTRWQYPQRTTVCRLSRTSIYLDLRRRGFGLVAIDSEKFQLFWNS